jgi:hypothetical protein
MNLRKRLENLERGFGCGDALTLIMADGSQQRLGLRGRYGTLDLFQRCFQNPHGPEAELIRTSVSQIDSSGGRMGELIWSFLHSPVASNEQEECGLT